ncbi:hypothetical protein K1W54_03800 [Micromonospora sp. CPCC 205371]|nr:hypothetical protein [Micromonospora sp. CPCC 205371]
MLLLVEGFQLPRSRAAFRGDLREAALQRRPPLGVNVVVAGRLVLLQLFDEVDLPSAKLIKLGAKSRPLGGQTGVLGGILLSLVEVQPALRTEDALAEEPADHGQDVIFAYHDALGVLVVPGLVLVVLEVGDAGVVDRHLLTSNPGLADHPPVTYRADDVRAQHVTPFGLPVRGVGARAAARALTEPGDRSGGLEDRPGDERFVGGAG